MERAGIPRKGNFSLVKEEGRIDVHWRRSNRSDPDHHHLGPDLQMRSCETRALALAPLGCQREAQRLGLPYALGFPSLKRNGEPAGWEEPPVSRLDLIPRQAFDGALFGDCWSCRWREGLEDTVSSGGGWCRRKLGEQDGLGWAQPWASRGFLRAGVQPAFELVFG